MLHMYAHLQVSKAPSTISQGLEMYNVVVTVDMPAHSRFRCRATLHERNVLSNLMLATLRSVLLKYFQRSLKKNTAKFQASFKCFFDVLKYVKLINYSKKCMFEYINTVCREAFIKIRQTLLSK